MLEWTSRLTKGARCILAIMLAALNAAFAAILFVASGYSWPNTSWGWTELGFTSALSAISLGFLWFVDTWSISKLLTAVLIAILALPWTFFVIYPFNG
jgi:hypothetical protein